MVLVVKKLKVKLLSHVRLFVTPWTVAHQAPQSMEFPRQEYWGGLPFPFPGDLPDPGIEPWSPSLQADTLPCEPEPTCQYRRHKRHGFKSWVRKISWRRARQQTPVFLPGESHGQRSLWATVHGVGKSWTRLKQLSLHAHMYK